MFASSHSPKYIGCFPIRKQPVYFGESHKHSTKHQNTQRSEPLTYFNAGAGAGTALRIAAFLCFHCRIPESPGANPSA